MNGVVTKIAKIFCSNIYLKTLNELSCRADGGFLLNFSLNAEFSSQTMPKGIQFKLSI